MISSVRKIVAKSTELCSSHLHLAPTHPCSLSLKRELEERNLLYQVTDDSVLPLLETGGQTVYMGIDPTADSLHSGHLKPLSFLAHVLRAGNRGILVLGGATARIGDPSGRHGERALLPPDTIAHNSAAIEECLKRITHSLGVSDRVTFVDNAEWYREMNVLDFFYQVGSALRLSVMLGKESVKNRLSLPHGLNFQEFSYQAFQAYDFLQLNRLHDCTVQMGGADQWGNITIGCDLVRKMTGSTVYGLTTQLLVDSRGNKLGKSLGGHPGSTMWLSPAKTAPYTLYQSFLGLDDATCLQLCKQLLPAGLEELRSLDKEHIANPAARTAHKKLASEVIRMVHGEDELRIAELATRIAFEDPSLLNEMEEGDISQLMTSVPCTKLSLQDNTGALWGDLLIRIGLTSTPEHTHKVMSQGLLINGDRVEREEEAFNPALHILKGKLTLIRIGKVVTFISWQE